MADLRATVDTLSLTASVSAGQLSGEVGYSAPSMTDYFEWRQETFDPFFHLPLNDPPGSTVAKALAGPDGLHDATVQPGAPGVIRPFERYPATTYDGDDTVVGDTSTFAWVHGTWVFTILFWGRMRGSREWPLATSVATPISPGFTWEILPARVSFRMKGDGAQAVASSVNMAQDPDESYHYAITGDGINGRMYVNGVQAEIHGAPPTFDGPSSGPLLIAGGNRVDGDLGGVIIDDRTWTAAEVRSDYLRGMGVAEP